ncbi:TIGR02147 family protein [Fibrobacter sp. UWT3]|uniref:TIGR02147 family protein n=1 Tax=Fibrobacter sp. UWT3 TaxID=1896225 RepID=UPI000BCFBCE3|nr:TIGR02147 family protein [Fibrobacter sp. UWT3]SOE45964.1 TIGR02147 family protein [Fibrobacter sp. UWT3]
MGEKKPSKKIFEYLDYREFLKDYYNTKKEANPAFSLRVFSDKIGFKAKDFISRVMNGDKNLSSQSIPKVASGLRLGKHETEFFIALVKFNQAETTEERNSAFGEMQAVLKVVRFAEKQHLLGHAQYMVYSHWRHLTIRSLIGMYGFDGDYEALARRVHPRITAEEAKASVKLLEDCMLIKKGKNGKYVLTENAITTGDRTSKLALRGFHQDCLKLAADSIDRDPPGTRHISGLTLGISQEGYERIVERINAFRKEIALIAEEDENSDKVFQLQFALFPVGGKD